MFRTSRQAGKQTFVSKCTFTSLIIRFLLSFRNPGNAEKSPWCFVEDKSLDRHMEFCNIPKCVDKIWLSIISISGFIAIAVILTFSIYVLKTKNTRGMKNIQNVR